MIQFFFCLNPKIKVICSGMEGILNNQILIDEEDDDFDDIIVIHILNNDLLGNRAALYGAFDLQTLNNIQCISMFRFEKQHIPRLVMALGLPEQISVDRVSIPASIGMCMLLRRLAYPNRLVDLECIFGYSSTVISNIVNRVLWLIEERKDHVLENLGNINFFNQHKLQEYAHAINQKGCPLQNCWAFIDGTAIAICRPTVNQEAYYSGHKKMHCLKYQSVCTPDGLIINLKGAYEGRRHDSGILRDSGLLEELQEHVVFPGQEFVLYGDQGYSLRDLLIRPYTQHEINQNADRQIFNNNMRAMRVSVEWGFGKVLQLFAFLDFRKNLKLLVQDVGRMYRVAVLLSNCHTCLYGGNTCQYFNINPPQLEDYLT